MIDPRLQHFIDSSPKEVDLTNEIQSQQILQLVGAILSQGMSISEIEAAEEELIQKNDDTLIFILLALKIAKSKLLAEAVKKPLLISVVFAVYKEHNRILKSSEHPHGEDFLRKKAMQLEWLFGDFPNIEWELIVVDDGCPEGSGEIAKHIVDAEGIQDKVHVLFLAEGIEQGHPVARTLGSTADSQKGGSIQYGMWHAANRSSEGDHVILYTDADLSTHLGQTMLLVDPLIHENKAVAIGSRREPNSVVIKKGARNDRGKMFIYLWKRMIPILDDIVDTQCGFKAFQAGIVPQLIENTIEKKFAFDIELLLKVQLQKAGSIEKVGIAWIDSEAASTTTDLQPYLPMLKAIAKMNHRYLTDNYGSNEFVTFIESLDEGAFNRILQKIPTKITDRNPDAFSDYDEVRVVDFRR